MDSIKKVLIVGLETRKEHFTRELLERFQREGCEYEISKDYEDAQEKLGNGAFDAMIIEVFLPSSNPAVGRRALELLSVIDVFSVEQGMTASSIVLYDEYADKMKCVFSQDNRRMNLPIAKRIIAYGKELFSHRGTWWESGGCGCCAAEGIFK